MKRIEFCANEAWDWIIGVQACQGQDEHGHFKMIEFGIGFFSLNIVMYEG